MSYVEHLQGHLALREAMNADGRTAANQRQLQAAALRAWKIVNQTIHPEFNKLINAFRSVFSVTPIVTISGGSMSSPDPQVIELGVQGGFTLGFTLDPRTEKVGFTSSVTQGPTAGKHLEEFSFDEANAQQIEAAIISFLNFAYPKE